MACGLTRHLKPYASSRPPRRFFSEPCISPDYIGRCRGPPARAPRAAPGPPGPAGPILAGVALTSNLGMIFISDPVLWDERPTWPPLVRSAVSRQTGRAAAGERPRLVQAYGLPWAHGDRCGAGRAARDPVPARRVRAAGSRPSGGGGRRPVFLAYPARSVGHPGHRRATVHHIDARWGRPVPVWGTRPAGPSRCRRRSDGQPRRWAWCWSTPVPTCEDTAMSARSLSASSSSGATNCARPCSTGHSGRRSPPKSGPGFWSGPRRSASRRSTTSSPASATST